MLKQFWHIESYGTSKENPETLLPKTKKKAVEVLNKTICKEKSGHYSVGLLWKNKNTKLPYNRQIAVSRLKSLENEPEFCQNYQQTIERSEKRLCNKIRYQTENKEIVNYIIYQAEKICVGLMLGQNVALLNENLLKGPNYLNKLISILIKF